MKTRIQFLFLAVAAGLALGTSAQAAPITVPEHSFEGAKQSNGGTLVSGGQSSFSVPAPWVKVGDTSVGVGWPTPGEYTTGLPDGDIYAFGNFPGNLSQILAATLQPDTTYTLTVGVGNRKDLPGLGFPNFPGYGIELWAGSTKLTSTYSTNQGGTGALPSSDQWIDVVATYTTPASVTADPLEIRLISYGIQTNYDNVRLDASPTGLTVTLTSPPDNEAYPSGTSVSATATVAWGTAPYTVKFFTRSLPGGTFAQAGVDVTTPPYTLDLEVLSAGSYEIYATVTDSAGPPVTATSATHTFSVADAIPTTTVLAAAGPPTTYGQNVTFTATVSQTPTGGTVQFYDDIDPLLPPLPLPLGSPVAVNTSTGAATYNTTTLGAGTHIITAQYSGYQIYNTSSTAASISQVVNQAPLTVKALNAFRAPNTANPVPFPYQITGYQNGEILGTSGVTGTPELSTTAVLASPVGDYPITCAVGTLTADNYSFTFVDGVLTVANPTPPGTLGSPQLITSDATSGISSTNTYTHAFNMGGNDVTINGVTFLAGGENGTGYSTTGFGFKSSGNFSEFPSPADAVATMLDPFRYYNDNAPGQTLTISGLTPGQMYDARIYYREFGTGDNRSTLITFDEDGAAPLSTSVTVNGDATPEAFYLSYTFTATSEPLLVSFARASGNTNASFHLSGFSVQTAGTFGFGTWADANGATGQTPQQDHDNDGVSNGIEFFMGETGSSFTATPGLDASNMISWPASAAYQGTYEVQTSPDLATWTNVDPRPEPSGGTLSYTLPPGAPGGKSFVRLFVTPTP